MSLIKNFLKDEHDNRKVFYLWDNNIQYKDRLSVEFFYVENLSMLNINKLERKETLTIFL